MNDIVLFLVIFLVFVILAAGAIHIAKSYDIITGRGEYLQGNVPEKRSGELSIQSSVETVA